MTRQLVAQNTGDTRKIVPWRNRPRRDKDSLERETDLHILLVEDNPADADLCVEYLQIAFFGHVHISRATQLHQACAVLKEAHTQKINAILLDLALPDAVGLEALIGLREIAPELPIVIVTGNSGSDIGTAAIREHAEDYCPKSALTPEALRRLLCNALERRRWRNSYRQLLELSPEGMVVIDAHDIVLFTNAAALAFTDETKPIKLGMPFPIAIPSELARGGEVAAPKSRIVSISVVGVDWDRCQARLLTLRDITASKLAEKRLLKLVRVDQLTGLASRTYFMDFLTRVFDRRQRGKVSLALMFIDLDHFKHINDSLGHRIGDELLRSVAKRLALCLRQGDFIGRLGGDEFGLILPAIKRPEEAAYVARKLLSALTLPFVIDGRELSVGASVGIAVYPGVGESTEELLRAADAAMYRAKEQGRNTYRFYSQDMHTLATARIKMEAALRRSLESQDFSLNFQPQVSVSGDRVVAMEALLRWTDSNYVHLGPEQFVPVAEDIGLIPRIGNWVLQQSIASAALWRRSLSDPVRVTVNVSAQQLRQPSFVKSVADTLAAAELAPHSLELEIVEHVFLDNIEQVNRTLEGLRQLGVAIVIDDFGTGYSSLNHLFKVPITGLKLDKHFIDTLGCNAQSEPIIENLIRMAHAIGLTVTAEGVETETQRAFLEHCGCDRLQGFYFCRPLPSARVLNELQRWPSRPRLVPQQNP